MTAQPVSPDDIAEAELLEDAEIWERRYKALTMRNAGASWHKIAEALGVGVYIVQKDVRVAMAEVVKVPVDEMVARQRSILLDLTRVNYTAALSGDREAQTQLLRVLEHEAKLYGLYAPTRVQVGISETEFAAQAAELLTALGTEPLRELAGLEPTPAPVIEGEVITEAPPDPEPESLPGTDGWSNV